MSKDVVTDKTRRPAGSVSDEMAEGAHDVFSPGVYKIVDADSLDLCTRNEGYEVVRVLHDEHVVSERVDEIPPVGLPALPTSSYGGYTAPLQPPADPRVITLWRTVHVPRVRFMVRLNPDSILRHAAEQIKQSQYEQQQSKQRAYDLEKKLAEIEKTLATETAEKNRKTLIADQEQKRSSEAEERYRSLETKLARERADKAKLMKAVGDLKAKEILGET